MGFEEALLDLQALASDQQGNLKKALELLEAGKEEEALKVIEGALEFAAWDTAFINNLPDSSFAVISPGGSKDSGGKTAPRSLRHLPYKDSSGKVDLPHLRNALARLSQTSISSDLKATARRKLEAAARSAGVGASAEKAASEIFAGEGWTVGVELTDADKSIQIIKTGQFKHPEHGVITITQDDLHEMVKHFRSGLRGQQVPVDVDHKHELGAVGWFKSLHDPTKVNGEYAIFADVDWTDKGKELVKGGSFKYFSPHFGEWVNPEDSRKYHNVLLSGAITNFPFLKGMQPVSFHEFKEGSVADNDTAVKVEDFNTLKESVEALVKRFDDSALVEEKRSLTERAGAAAELSDDKKKELVEAIKASKLSDEDKGTLVKRVETPSGGGEENEGDKKELSELRNEFKGREEELQTALTGATARIQLIEREKRTIKFMELVTGKRGDDPPWVSDTDKHIKLMEALADKFGEDSEELKSYIEIQSSHAKQIAEGKLLSEIGTSGGGPATETEAIDVGVKKLMEVDKDLTLAEATSKFLESPEGQKFYAAYDRAEKTRTAKAGG